jgi:hypothetical protein
MISSSLDYLRDSDNVVMTVFIGGLLLLTSPLIVPSILVLGYVSRVLRQTADGDDMPPEFDDWGDLFSEGLKGFVVTLVYSLLPVMVFALAVVFGVGAAVLGSGGGANGALGGLLGGTVALLLAVAAFVVSIAGVYVTPAALAAVVLIGIGGAAGAVAATPGPDNASGDAGPPSDLPDQVPDFVGDLLDAIADGVPDGVDGLGETVSDIAGNGTDDGDGADGDQDDESDETADEGGA